MDYLTPLAQRRSSFKEFMEEWVLDQFVRSLARYGLAKPWINPSTARLVQLAAAIEGDTIVIEDGR